MSFRAIIAIFMMLLAAPALAQSPGEQKSIERAREFVTAFNTADIEAVDRYAVKNFAPELLQKMPADERRAMLQGMQQQLGALKIGKVITGENSVRIRAEDKNGQRLVLRFQFQAAPPYLISNIGLDADEAEAEAELPALALPADRSPKVLGRAIDTYISGLAEADRFSGSVLIARGKDIVLERQYGFAHQGYRIPNTAATRFHVGSITKDFTKVAIGQLAQAGKLDLNAPIIRYLPDYPNREVAGKVTVGQLVAHTSGLGDLYTPEIVALNPRLFRSPEDFIPRLAANPLQFEPGKARRYSNYGYAVLGAIISAVSGVSYYDYVQKNVFERAGMAHSAFFYADGPNPDVARGYTTKLKEAPGELRDFMYVVWGRGMSFGGAYATARDMLSFDGALRNYRLLNPAWTRWFFAGAAPGSAPEAAPAGPATFALDAAGGNLGLNAALNSNGNFTMIILSNRDEPIAERLADRLKPAFTSR